MSKDLDNTAKKELNKHINSKLFQKFLSKEAAKISETNIQKPLSKPSLKKSPIRSRREQIELNPEDRARSLSRGLNKTLSQRPSLKTLREISPVQRKESPTRVTKNYELDLSDVRRSQYDSPGLAGNTWKPEDGPNFIPVYTADPLLLKQLENDKKTLQDDLKRTVDKYELMLRKKSEELKRVHKQNEHLKIINEELMSKIEQEEDWERKAGSLKSERDLLERKIHSVEAESENYKRQIDHLRESCEAYKSQIEDYERTNRSKTHDVDRELRMVKDRTDDLERQVLREKERQQDTERKLNKSKEKNFALESELARAEDKVKKLERDLQEAKDRISHEANHQIRETEVLRRKIEDLTQEILRREKTEEYKKRTFEPEFFNTTRESRPRDFEEEPRRKEFVDQPRRREFGESLGPQVRRDAKRDDRGLRDDPISWQKKEDLRPAENVKGLEGKLMALQMDKKRLEDELAKIPFTGRRIAQMKRKEEIELELEILNTNISTIKSKLRQVNVL